MSAIRSTTIPAAAALLACVLGLALLVAVSPTAEAEASHAKFAKTMKTDGTLKKGCKNYPYRYRVDPPEEADGWGLEVFLVDPAGRNIASGGVLSGEPERGKELLRFCRPSTEPGKFKLRGKFTYRVRTAVFEDRIKTTRFRLRR